MASEAEAAEKMQPSQKIALSDLKPIGGRRKQGDQMSLSKKIAQNVAQPKSILNWRKLTKKIWATCNFFIKKLPTVNTRPIGENSPNLVTL
jgi:hypothetical protein